MLLITPQSCRKSFPDSEGVAMGEGAWRRVRDALGQGAGGGRRTVVLGLLGSVCPRPNSF